MGDAFEKGVRRSWIATSVGECWGIPSSPRISRLVNTNRFRYYLPWIVASDCETCSDLNDDDIVDSVILSTGVPGGGKAFSQGYSLQQSHFRLGRHAGEVI